MVLLRLVVVVIVRLIWIGRLQTFAVLFSTSPLCRASPNKVRDEWPELFVAEGCREDQNMRVSN